MPLTMHFDGNSLRILNYSLERTRKEVAERGRRAMRAQAQKLLAESRAECPVDTGALKASARVEKIEDGETVRYIVSYGGTTNPKSGKSTTEYMLAVHERLDVYHPVGKAKFLEDPANRMASDMEAAISAYINLR